MPEIRGHALMVARPRTGRPPEAAPVRAQGRAPLPAGVYGRSMLRPYAPRAAIPRRVRPMLATLVEKPFDREGWVFEIKWDGYRAIAEKTGDCVRLYSRTNQPFSDRFGPVVEALKELAHEAVLDGEVVVLDKEGRSSFQLLQDYDERSGGNLTYYVFDIIYLDGYDLSGLPLVTRKALLKQVLRVIRYSDHVETRGIALFEAARKMDVEGIVAKDGSSRYVERRTSLWRKIKVVMRQEAIICGFTAPQGARSYFGSLVLGVYEGEKRVHIGHAGTGFDERALASLHARLSRLATKVSPFAKPPRSNAPVTWVKPRLVCEVKFTEWTKDGLMRHPVFVGLRDDKPPREVRREGYRARGPFDKG